MADTAYSLGSLIMLLQGSKYITKIYCQIESCSICQKCDIAMCSQFLPLYPSEKPKKSVLCQSFEQIFKSYCQQNVNWPKYKVLYCCCEDTAIWVCHLAAVLHTKNLVISVENWLFSSLWEITKFGVCEAYLEPVGNLTCWHLFHSSVNLVSSISICP